MGALAIDSHDDRINRHTLQNGVKWKRFPVTYYIDPSDIATLTLMVGSITDAVKKAFPGYDDQVTYTLFAQTTTPSAAKIKVQWNYINGTLKQAPSFISTNLFTELIF